MNSVKKFAAFTLAILFFSCGKSTSVNDFFSMQLNTLQHQPFQFSELKDNKASVFLFIQPECPFCNSYGKIFHQLDSSFTSMNVKMYGVLAGTNYPDSEMISYTQKFNLSFPVLLDPQFQLTKKIGARVTPQAFLIDQSGKIRYEGLVDDWAYEIGKQRPKISNHYLLDAATALVSNQKIPIDSTKALGCYIQ
jgi:peroxiredoxin